MRVALASRQSLTEVESWDDAQLATVLAVLSEQADAVEEARRGR